MQHIALKAAFVLLAVGLQKPSKISKAKDHQECVAERLVLWKEGEIDTLLREGRIIQRHLDRSRKADPPNKAKIFAKLVRENQIDSVLRYLSEEDCGGVLPWNNSPINIQTHNKLNWALFYSGQWRMFRSSYISK